MTRGQHAIPELRQDEWAGSRDDLLRGEKSSLPFRLGSSCPGGRGTRRVLGVKRLGWSLVFPGEVGKESGGGGPKNSKTSARGRGDNLYMGPEIFEKPPPWPPAFLASKEIIATGPGGVSWSR